MPVGPAQPSSSMGQQLNSRVRLHGTVNSCSPLQQLVFHVAPSREQFGKIFFFLARARPDGGSEETCAGKDIQSNCLYSLHIM